MTTFWEREDWDSDALAAFLAAAPESEEAARVLFLRTVGDRFARYVGYVLPAVSRCTGASDSRIIEGLLTGLAQYYLAMAAALNAPSVSALPRWDECRNILARHPDLERPAIVLTFQLGLPLLIPPMVATACGRSVAVYMHPRNPSANAVVRKTEYPVRALDVLDPKDRSSFRAAASLAAGSHLLANVDTRYHGTRAVSVPFLHGELCMPAGMLNLIPRRTRAPVIGLVLLFGSHGPDVRIGRLNDPAHGEFPVSAEAVRAFFEPLVREAPFQWMGWASLQSV